MITGTKEKLDDLAKGYVCKDDGQILTVAWHAGENSYVLRCGKGHFPEEITPMKSVTDMYKHGEELPPAVERNVEKGIARRSPQTVKPPAGENFTGIPPADLETGEVLSLEKLRALVNYARRYDLDPHRGHVALMYGEPYITIDGYIYSAHRKKQVFSLSGHSLTEDELRLHGYESGDIGWLSKVRNITTGADFEGYGFVTMRERTEMSKKRPERLRNPVVAEKPGSMVIKRADWQALRRAFPIGESDEGEESTQ